MDYFFISLSKPLFMIYINPKHIYILAVVLEMNWFISVQVIST